MRIDVLAIGSRGDVEPYVALGVGLRRAGYQVRMVTLGGFGELVQSRGLEHLAIAETPQQIAGTAEGREWVRKRSSASGFLRGLVRVADSLIGAGIRSYRKARQDAEALIVSPMGMLVGQHIAERLQAPLIRAQLAPPVVPTRYSWDGRTSLGTVLQGGLAVFVDASFHLLLWTQLRGSTNAARREILQLPPLSLTAPMRGRHRRGGLLLGGYSPAVAPRLPDWDDWIQVTGYWFPEELPGWTPPRELEKFLGAGAPPVFIGFGSTPFPKPEATTTLLLRALARAGKRGILVAGGSGLPTGQLSPELLSVDSVPHEWLFSRVCAAVHHGGAGVTGAALRAGLPSVVVPVFADQPFWGKRVAQLGAGPAPIAAGKLTEDKLAAAIQATGGSGMRGRAATLGQQIRGEDGVARAVEIMDKHLSKCARDSMRRANAG